MKIVATSMEQICADVVTAATDALKAHGIPRPAVVVNFAWKDEGIPHPYACGTAVPKRHRKIMADSLAESAEEAQL